jgi:phage gp36-like protein
MAYATIADMLRFYRYEELVERTNLDGGNATAVNETVLAQALDDATAEIDGYLAGRYPLPLAAVPPLLDRFCRMIARKNLYNDAPPSASGTEQWRREYEDATGLLALIGKGRMELPGQAQAVRSGTVLLGGDPQTFSPQANREW